MKMVQTLYPCEQPWTEVLYDGELPVVDNTVEFDEVKFAHWIDVLYLLGYEPVDETATKKERKTHATRST